MRITTIHAYLCILVALLPQLVSPSVFAQQSAPSTPAAAAAPSAPPLPFAKLHPVPALLKEFNRPIIVFRAEVYGATPEERVRLVNERLVSLIAKGGRDEVTTRLTTEGAMIEIDGEMAFVITPLDVDAISGETLEKTAETTAKRLSEALAAFRAQHSWGFLLRTVVKVFMVTILFLLFILLVHSFMRWSKPVIQAFSTRMAMRLESTWLSMLAQFAPVVNWVVAAAGCGVLMGATYAWITFSLKQFPYTKPWGEQLGGFIFDSLDSLMGGLIRALPDFFVIVIILLVARWLTKLVRFYFRAIEDGHLKVFWLEKESARPTSRIIMVVIWALALVMVYPYIPGSSSAAFKGVSVFAGLLLSLGASSVVGQVMGGLVLMYSRALKPGEFVQVGENMGVVLEVGFLATKIRTPRNEEVNIPNGLMLSTTSKNFTRLAGEHGAMMHTKVTIGYDTPWRQVHEMLKIAADRTAEVLKDPKPIVYQCALSDFYVEYELQIWVKRLERPIVIMSELNANIQDVFNEYGVQIMSPHFMANPPEKVWVPKEKWSEPPAGQKK